MSALTEVELSAIAIEIDNQLSELYQTNQALSNTRAAKHPPAAPKQQALIEQATGEKFATFWDKFRRLLRDDLCKPDGKLYQQWKKYGDLDSKTTASHIHSLLLGMGIAAHSLTPLAIAATVIVLNTLLNIGIKAICEDC